MSLLGKQDLNILVDEVKQDVNRKVNAIKGDLFAPSENTKLATINGTKEFKCGESGYVDNVYLEGETLINVGSMARKDGSHSDGVVRTRFNLHPDDSFKTNQRISDGTFTLYNFTDKAIVYVGQNSSLAWGVSYRVPAKSCITVNIPSTDSLCGVDFMPSDGWSNSDMNIYTPNMYMVVEGEYPYAPYFNNIASVGDSCKMSISTYTKSPINIGNIVIGAMDTNSGAESVDPNYKRNDKFVPCDTVEYTINTCENKGQIVVLFYDENKNYISFTHSEDSNYVTFTPPANARFLRFRFRITGSDISPILYKGADKVVNYDKQHINQSFRKSSTTVKDLLYKINDKYYKLQKCVELTLDPNKVMDELWFTKNADGFIGFKIDNSNIGVKPNSSCMCNRFRNLGVQTQDSIHVSDSVNHCFAVSIFASRLATQDIPGFKKWLTDNPTPLVIELETPIMVELPNFNPRTFKGENVIVVDTGVVSKDISFDVTTAIRNEMEVVKDKVNSAFLFGSNVKNDLADKLTSVGVPNMSVNNTFAELIANIPEGKSVTMKTGTFNSVGAYKTFTYTDNKGVALYYGEIKDLNFRPKILIFACSNTAYGFGVLCKMKYYYNDSGVESILLSDKIGVGVNSTVRTVIADSVVFGANNLITLPLTSGTGIYNYNYLALTWDE